MISTENKQKTSLSQPTLLQSTFLQSAWHWISKPLPSRYFASLTGVVLLSACVGTPLVQEAEDDTPAPVKQVTQVENVVSMQNRLDRVSGTLLVNSAPLCRKKVRNLLGFSASNKYSYLQSDPDVMAQTFGLGEQLQVSHIIPGSGAARAGLQSSDILLEINGKTVPRGRTAENETMALLSPIVAKNTPVDLVVQRSGNNQTLTIPLTQACGFRVELGNTDDVAAYSDGQRILITRGMLRFARSDKELAYVIAKEMAHNILGHAKALRNVDVTKSTIDYLIQANPRVAPGIAKMKPVPRKQDIDADMLGFAIALRGGYEIDYAPAFWGRLAKQYPATMVGSYTELHPSSQARLDAMPKSITRIKAIEAKRKARIKRGS